MVARHSRELFSTPSLLFAPLLRSSYPFYADSAQLEKCGGRRAIRLHFVVNDSFGLSCMPDKHVSPEVVANVRVKHSVLDADRNQFMYVQVLEDGAIIISLLFLKIFR
jgi:hypothetical protein